MTLSSTAHKTSYTCTGATEYSVPFYFLDEDDLDVYREDTEGTVTLLTKTTEYTVAGEGNPAGGTVTTISTYTDGKIIIVRTVDETQILDLINGDGFDADTLEQALDRLTMLVQQLGRRVAYAIRLPDSDVTLADTELPTPVASKILSWNATGDAITAVAPNTGVIAVGSVDTDELADGAVTGPKIATGASTIFVSSNDTTEGPLNGKLVAGSNLSLTETGDGGDETLVVDRVFRGASLARSAAQAITTGTPTGISFDTEGFDTDGFHESVTNPTRITIPANVSYVRFTARVHFDPSATGYRTVTLERYPGGYTAGYAIDNNPNASNPSVLLIDSGPLAVSEDDYFVVAVYQNSGGDLDAGPTIFSVEVLE